MKLALYLASGALLASVTTQALATEQNRGYYRDPALHQDTLIFTAEGDLWRASVRGGNATRLTTSDAEERYAAISPDGQWVAFVADYEGAPEVYVLPIHGGLPKRVTFENSRARVQGWTPEGHILYSTDHVMGPANQWVLRTVDPATLNSQTIPLTDAFAGAFNLRAEGRVVETQSTELNADGEYETTRTTIDPVNPESLFFVRFGLKDATADNARIYRGGAMGQLWRFSQGDSEATRLATHHVGSVRRPMVDGTRVYFISDSDGTPNLWSTDANGADIQQHTRYNDYQVWSAAVDAGRIVYQQGADLKLLDTQTGNSEIIDIQLTSDFAQRQERWLDTPLDYLTATHFNAEHERVTLTARSQIGIVGRTNQRIVTVSTPAGSRSRNATLSPDGQWVYALNDHSGENEIWRFPADGSTGASQLTDNANTFRWGLYISPNGQYIAHDDKNGDLWLLNLNNGANTKIATGGWGHQPYQDVVWSADSELIAFTRRGQQGKSTANAGTRPQIVLYSLAEERELTLTSEKYESFSPTFSHDGNWLYFVSNRNFTATPGSPWGDRNMGAAFDKRGQLFAVSLKAQACFPFEAPREVAICDAAAVTEARANRRNARVDWDGLPQRLWQVPVDADNYRNLHAAESLLFAQRSAIGSRGSELVSIAISSENPKVTTFASNVSEYQLSTDRKHIFWRTRDNQMLSHAVQAQANSDLTQARFNANQWKLAFDPTEEWQQMFRDAWLMHRDFLFDGDMRGVDWQATRDKYAPLLKRVTDRHELDDLFAQMMSELNVLHSQVRGGEYPSPNERAQAASLGAALESTVDGVRIRHIYQTDPELPNQASPLAQPGVNARVGDYIQAINGQPVENLAQAHQALRNQAGQPVLLELQRGRNKHRTIITPVTLQRDHRLRYEDWIERNRQTIAASSQADIGYLHLYAMGANDVASFAREFYANIGRDGLIIDVRRNRGGNIDSWVIEKLLRRAWAFWEPNTHGAPYTNMQQTFRGHLVVLTDELTYSDGETFSAGVKALGLGPLVGKRTAGAGVWLSGRNTLADGGVARVAETAQFAMDGRWVIEGYGVEPDYVVENLPHATFNGHDAQLQYAIQLLERQLDAEPITPLRSQPMLIPIADDINP